MHKNTTFSSNIYVRQKKKIECVYLRKWFLYVEKKQLITNPHLADKMSQMSLFDCKPGKIYC